MSNLRDLYQQLIVDHSKNPHNFRTCEHSNHHKEGFNPLCGDKVTVYIRENNGIIEEVCFQGSGCAISMASASLMSEALKGKTVNEALELFNSFQQLVTGDINKQTQPPPPSLGKHEFLGGVAEFPMRVKCATLPWHTFKAALLDEKTDVTTE